MNIFRSSIALGSFFSGCIAIHPGSIILTIDASSISEDDRAELKAVGVFVCDEGQEVDCSVATNYDKLDTLLSDNGLREKETIGLSLKDFTGPVHLRLIAGEKNPSFDSANDGVVAQAEAFVDVAARDNLVLPLGLLATPQDVFDLPTTAGRDLVDLFTLGCGKNQPFISTWIEFDGANSSLQLASFDLKQSVDAPISLLNDANSLILDVEQAGNADCDLLGLGVLKVALDPNNPAFLDPNDPTPFVAQAVRLDGGAIFQNYQAGTFGIGNLNMGFAADEGFSMSWDANLGGGLNQSFLQTSTNLQTLAPTGQLQSLRGAGGEGFAKSTTAGGPQGVSIFVDQNNQELKLLDLSANRDNTIATSKSGRFPFDPQVAFLDGARILTVWFDCQDVDCRVVGRITDRAGQEASNKFPTLNDTADFCTSEVGCFEIAEQQTNPFDLAVAVGPDGGFVVAWRFQANSGIADGFELQAVFYGTDGPRLNPFSRAADVASVSPLANANLSQESIQAAVTPTGDVVISWIDAVGAGVGGAARQGLEAKISIISGGLPNLAASKK